MSNITEDNFIEVLLNETCELEENASFKKIEETTNLVSLRDYFEKKVNEVEYINLHLFLSENNVRYATLKYQAETKMYRMNLNNQDYDFPENWSFFQYIEKEMYWEHHTDNDFLNELFSEMVGYDYQLAFVNEDKQCDMIFVPIADLKKCKEWLREYAIKKMEKTIAA